MRSKLGIIMFAIVVTMFAPAGVLGAGCDYQLPDPPDPGAVECDEPLTEEELETVVVTANQTPAEGIAVIPIELELPARTDGLNLPGGLDSLAPGNTLCRYSGEVLAAYQRVTATARTITRASVSGSISCFDDPVNPVGASGNTTVTDHGVPVFGSDHTDSASASVGLNQPFKAVAQNSVYVYNFPSEVHGLGSLYTWDFTLTFFTDFGVSEHCFHAEAADPGAIALSKTTC